ELSKLPINLAILGSGDKEYNDFFESIKGKYENIFIKVGYDEPFSRKMYAAGDFLLMPSLFEPCGLNQMIAMRYAALVVARKTGGLNDTVIDISQPDGYGILFENPNEYEFLNAVNRAIDLYNNKQKFSELQKKVMGFDFSIESTAQKYIKLYESLKYSREVVL
ncbi:glycosyltransferase, partial [Sulfurihydrogenibium azorense]